MQRTLNKREEEIKEQLALVQIDSTDTSLENAKNELDSVNANIDQTTVRVIDSDFLWFRKIGEF